jgi:hypothetical protein
MAALAAPGALRVNPGWPAELALLLGPDAGGILVTATGAAGGELRGWSPRQVSYAPDRSTVVQYRAEIAWPGRSATTEETIVAATGRRIPEGAAVLDDGTTRVGVWRWPYDPALPGLAAALDRERVGRLLDSLGIDGGTVRLRARSYRPTGRAVVEATGRLGRIFLKVVAPQRVESLHGTHRALVAHVPVPDTLGWSDDGIVVLRALRGRTLREVLRSAKEEPPPPGALDALLDRLPATEAAHRPRRRDVFARAEHHGAVIAATVPALAGAVYALLEGLRTAPRSEHPVVAVHGDFYDAQLLVERGRITGLLDVDTAGAGHRVDDLANLIAHLSVLALISDRPKRINRYGASVLAHAEEHHDPLDLRARVAASIVGLATGPFRGLERDHARSTARYLELARAWFEGT